jgi:hypothetical protein
VNWTLRILGIPVVSLSTDDDAGDPGPGASADVSLAPGFVPAMPYHRIVCCFVVLMYSG